MAYQAVDFGPSRKEGAEEGIDRDARVPNPRGLHICSAVSPPIYRRPGFSRNGCQLIYRQAHSALSW